VTQKKNIEEMVDQLIQEERNEEFNPFLSTRVLAAVQNRQNQKEKKINPAWKTIMVAAGITAAVFLGISIGSIYESENKTDGITLSNDGSMENFGFYSQIGEE
jgi:cytochrome P450